MPRQEIPKHYNPKGSESPVYDFWLKGKYFSASTDSGKKPYTIVIPPPNVTDVLHLGHALNNTLQDIMIRFKRMQGYETLWLPGTDHAGIATQVVIEKRLAKEGKSRWDLGRDKFVQLIWDWVNTKGDYILNQLKKLGFSCDWSRTRFTLDQKLSQAVSEVFVHLYNKGLIYRGKYIINWCPRCLTSLSDDEVVVKEENGSLWYVKYPVQGEKDKFIRVATTRPETMLGDTAVVVNPEDKRYKAYIGKKAILPLVGRELPVVADSYVDPEFGTGAVKVTPAHDRNDFEMAQRHNLEFVEILNPDATLNENGEKFKGLDRFEARKRIVRELEGQGLLEKIEPYQVPLGYCYRCDTVVEPYLSEQWFVKMKPLAGPAIEAAKTGKLRFHPEHWEKTYLHWLEDIRDWCISRQLWWGHQIPVWCCKKCGEIIVARTTPSRCGKCNSTELEQDQDVLDTWFSSWLWTFSTLGWPEETKDLEFFYPTKALFTASEIIFLWVARMVMAGYEFRGQLCFEDVCIHGTVKDSRGIRMSKSLGNGIDPLDVIKEYGADSLRYSLVLVAPDGQDPHIAFNSFELGRNFCNKLWNASRLVMMNLQEFDSKQADLSGEEDFTLADRWILSRLQQTIQDVTGYLDSFRFNLAGKALYDFFWGDFCDWYLETVKLRFREENSSQDGYLAKKVSVYVLERVLRLLSPFIPFVTEQIWRNLYGYDWSDTSKALMMQSWPIVNQKLSFKESLVLMGKLQEIIVSVRTLKSDLGLAPAVKPRVILRTETKKTSEFLEKHSAYITDLARVEKPEISTNAHRPEHSATSVVSEVEIYLPLEGLVDWEAEKRKLSEEQEKLIRLLAQTKARLEDQNFLNKAPALVVEKEKSKMEDLELRLAKIRKHLEALK